MTVCSSNSLKPKFFQGVGFPPGKFRRGITRTWKKPREKKKNKRGRDRTSPKRYRFIALTRAWNFVQTVFNNVPTSHGSAIIILLRRRIRIITRQFQKSHTRPRCLRRNFVEEAFNRSKAVRNRFRSNAAHAGRRSTPLDFNHVFRDHVAVFSSRDASLFNPRELSVSLESVLERGSRLCNS